MTIRAVTDRALHCLPPEPVAFAPAMTSAMDLAHAFAPAATPIVLHGESGSGKTFFAEYIHDLSQRSGAFHVFSVGTVASQLAADELFGHVQGAYTDARGVRPGRIAAAAGGTLLLDDMQGVDLGLQKQLLQVLDRGTFSPVGSDRVLTVACRIMFAMTEAPDVLMKKGALLKDLRHRFGACAIRIPSLDERREEIPLLVNQALDRCRIRTNVEGPSRFSKAALALLRDAEYEGNVRQLEGVVTCAYLMARADGAEEIGPEHVPEEICPLLRYHRRGDREANRVAVERALRLTGGNVTAAARRLGISRNALNGFRRARKVMPDHQISSSDSSPTTPTKQEAEN